MKKIVHVAPVREREGTGGAPAVRGRDVERREEQLAQVKGAGATLAEVPWGEEGHTFWPRRCGKCHTEPAAKQHTGALTKFAPGMTVTIAPSTVVFLRGFEHGVVEGTDDQHVLVRATAQGVERTFRLSPENLTVSP